MTPPPPRRPPPRRSPHPPRDTQPKPTTMFLTLCCVFWTSSRLLSAPLPPKPHVYAEGPHARIGQAHDPPPLRHRQGHGPETLTRSSSALHSPPTPPPSRPCRLCSPGPAPHRTHLPHHRRLTRTDCVHQVQLRTALTSRQAAGRRRRGCSPAASRVSGMWGWALSAMPSFDRSLHSPPPHWVSHDRSGRSLLLTVANNRNGLDSEHSFGSRHAGVGSGHGVSLVWWTRGRDQSDMLRPQQTKAGDRDGA
jgi:hypothetical protein